MGADDKIKGDQVTVGSSRPQSGRHDPSKLDGKQNHARFDYSEYGIPKITFTSASEAHRAASEVFVTILDRLEDPERD